MRFNRLLRRKTTLVIRFDSRRALVVAMDHLLVQNMGSLLDLGRTALITRAGDAPPVVINNSVMAREGGISGAAIGAASLALGMIQQGVMDLPGTGAVAAVALSALVGAGLGGLIGRLAAGTMGFGFRREMLDRVAGELAAGEVALVLRVCPASLPSLRRELASLNAKFILQTDHLAQY